MGKETDRLHRLVEDMSVSDDVLKNRLREVWGSLNADANASSALAFACMVGRKRPRLLEAALRYAIAPAVASCVTTIDGFWTYFEYLIRQDVQSDPPSPIWWSREAQDFFKMELPRHRELIESLIREQMDGAGDEFFR